MFRVWEVSASEGPCCLQPLLQISWGFLNGYCGQCTMLSPISGN